MPGRSTEHEAREEIDLDAWMQRRIGYFGAPCLTTQEYRAVVFSLYGLPDFRLDKQTGEVPVDIEIEVPTQKHVAARMHIRQQRVSQLLESAGLALDWFEEEGTPDVGWFRLPHGRGAAAWDFRAPVLDHPIPPDPAQRKVRVDVVRQERVYKLAFAGEL